MARVIVADDSEAIRKALSQILLKANHEVVAECSDDGETLENFKTLNPDLVFLDWEMPKTDGLTVLKEIKKIDSHDKIIMVTAHDEMSLIEKCIKEGAMAYITKPFDDEKIYDAVSFALD